MTSIRTTCNPNMLKWARDEVGYSIEQAAEAIGISAESVVAAEHGDPPLTLNQLRKAAEHYGCPFGYFYLSKPPHKKSYNPIPDFRIEPSFVGVDHYRLNLELKKVRDRRILYIELAKDVEQELKGFEKLSGTDRQGSVGSRVRQRLGINNTELASLPYEKVYSYWKGKIEDDGVLVYESQYIPDVSGVLGAAICYDVCPIILIKRGSKRNARRLFTLLHEYAHLLYGASAINDASSQTVRVAGAGKKGVETACNGLAAEILIPADKFDVTEYAELDPVEKMKRLAESFKVTYTTAAVFLRRNELISEDEFLKLLELRREAYESSESLRNAKVMIPREILMRLDMGRPMFRTVLKAYGNGALDIFDVSRILNLRVGKIAKLAATSVE